VTFRWNDLPADTRIPFEEAQSATERFTAADELEAKVAAYVEQLTQQGYAEDNLTGGSSEGKRRDTRRTTEGR